MTSKKVVEGNCECNHDHCKGSYSHANCGGSGAIYGIGLVGAAFYFFPQAVGLEQYILAFLKSIIWPGLLVYRALTLLGL